MSQIDQYLISSNTGTNLTTNEGVSLSGTLIVSVLAGNLYQLRNSSASNIRMVNYNNSSASITIVRIN